MPYKLKISGLQFEAEIEGAQDWARSVTRDFNDRIFRTRGDYRFVGHQGLYNLLYNHITLNGVCEALEGRIYFNTGTAWDYEWKGDLLPQDIEYDLLKRSADAQVLDASWSAKFNNSQDQKIKLRSTTSKNGISINQCDYTLCQFFDPTDATLSNYLPDKRICFRVYDVFKFLVAYYSDDSVSFTSDFFNIGGDGDQYWITTGQEIREATNWVNPEISFSELFEEMNKKLNLWIIIEGTQDAPILRIEPQEYVFSSQLLLTVADPENLVMKTDLDQLYTIIKVGSPAPSFGDTNADYPTHPLFAWNDEEFNTQGDCEFENNTLELSSTWRIDHNSINQLIQDSTFSDYDDDIFVIEIDPTAPDYDAFKFTTEYTADLTDPTPDTDYYIYNYNLINEQVIIRWLGGIPSQIVTQFNTDAYVRVSNPLGLTFGGPGESDVFFNDDTTAPNADTDGLYTTPAEAGGITGPNVNQFAPTIAGFYLYNIHIAVTANTVSAIDLKIKVYEDNTRAREIGSYTLDRTTLAPDTMSGTQVIYIPEGGVAVVRIDKIAAGIFTLGGSSFCEITGQNLQFNEPPDDPLIYIYDAAEFKLSRTDFDTLDQGRGFVRILDTNAKKAYDVWAKDVKYNSTTGTVEVAEFIGGGPPLEVCWVLETGYWDDDCYWLDNELLPGMDATPFIMTVDTTQPGATANDQFQIPTTGGGYNYVVDWGDGQIDTGQTGNATHTYAAGGTYTVKIYGIFPRIYFALGGDRLKVSSVDQWGVIQWGSFNLAFAGCGNMVANWTDTPDLSGCTSLYGAFYLNAVLTGGNWNWDTSTITDMAFTFAETDAFNEDITSWDVSAVQFFGNTFRGATIFNRNIGGWNTGAATDMEFMFSSALAFNQAIGSWNVSSVTDMSDMFNGATAFNQSLSGWDVSSVTDMDNMFAGVGMTFDQDLGSWTPSALTTAVNMFDANLSTANYNSLLTGWTGWTGGAPTKSLQDSVTFDANLSTYSLGSDAAAARAYLTAALPGGKNWSISDGGGV